MFGEHPCFDFEEIRSLARPLAEYVMATVAEVAVFAGHLPQVVERRQRGQPDEEIPILEKRQGGIERPGLGEETALDQQGVERDVVVDQEDVRIEVAAVGEAAFA